jgi:hypothetical protein
VEVRTAKGQCRKEEAFVGYPRELDAAGMRVRETVSGGFEPVRKTERNRSAGLRSMADQRLF